MLIHWEDNTCESCWAHYSTYKIWNEINSNFEEYWCELPYRYVDNWKLVFKKPKWLCQFCNKKSRYYLWSEQQTH